MTNQNPSLIDDLYNQNFELIIEHGSQENIDYFLYPVFHNFDRLSDENKAVFAKKIFTHNLFEKLIKCPTKDEIIKVINNIFDELVTEKGVRNTVKAKYLIQLCSLSPELAQTYVAQYENDLCSLICKGADLALMNKYFAPMSAKINLHTSLLFLKNYKTNALEENFKAIDFIYNVFDTLTPKVQRSMFTLIQTIMEHHLSELSRDDYFQHQDKLLSLLQQYPKLLSAYKGIDISRLLDATNASPLVLQYGLYPYMEITLQEDQSVGICSMHIRGFNYHESSEIAGDFLTHFNVPGRANFQDFLLEGFAFNSRNADFLNNYLQVTTKISEIILILRLIGTEYLNFSQLFKYYKPLKIIEDFYKFPVKQRLDDIIQKNMSFMNTVLEKNKDKHPHHRKYLGEILAPNSKNLTYKKDFQTLINDIIFHLISKEQRMALHTESVLMNQTHPLNVSRHFGGLVYNADTDTFQKYDGRISFSCNIDEARKEVEMNIQRLNEILLDTALSMGYTTEEIDLLF